MAYTTAELVLGKSRLENDNNIDVSQHIIDAQARIDAKLRKRYKVPFKEPVPPIISSIATNFAAGFLIERDYSNRSEKYEPYLAEVLIKRADADLAEVLEDCLLDGLDGVEYVPVAAAPASRPMLLSTSSGKSEMERALSRWP